MASSLSKSICNMKGQDVATLQKLSFKDLIMTKGMARNEQSHANEYVANIVLWFLMAMDVHFQVDILKHFPFFPLYLEHTIYIYRNQTIFSQKKKLDWNMEGY